MSNTVRILVHGGAALWKDNSAFEFASKNVEKDYKKDTRIERFFLENGANQLVEYINNQTDESIQSLDIFCHVNYNGLYLNLGAKLNQDTNKNFSNLYRNFKEMASDILDYKEVLLKNQKWLWHLNLVKFTISCKIKIHGCRTASVEDTKDGSLIQVPDNFCQLLSEGLRNAGRNYGVVIGHRGKISSMINGSKTTLSQQDYRYGERSIYHSGILKMITTEKGRITPNTIKQAVSNVTTTPIIKK